MGFDLKQSRPLGHSGLRVTILGFGAAAIGGLFESVEHAAAVATVRHAYEVGVRYFDVAPLYGYGNAETRVGAALAAFPRDAFVLSTKVGRLLRSDAPIDSGQRFGGVDNYYYRGTPNVNPVFDFSEKGIRQSIEDSLERLALDRIDVLLIHDPDDHYDQALAATYPTLRSLKKDGVISAIGVGMNQSALLTRFAREAEFDCFLVAGRYTLLDQEALNDLLPVCEERGISVVIGGVYNSGILADPKPGSRFNYVPAPPDRVEKARQLKAICDAHGVPLKAAAIQFPLAHPAVATVLAGARTADELDDSVAMLSVEIPPSLWEALQDSHLLPRETPIPKSC